MVRGCTEKLVAQQERCSPRKAPVSGATREVSPRESCSPQPIAAKIGETWWERSVGEFE